MPTSLPVSQRESDPLFRCEAVQTTRGRAAEHTHPLLGVDLDVYAGRVTGVVGPSGAGKSTLLRLLNRMEEPTGGHVFFHGEALSSYDVLDLRRRVGLLMQFPTPFPGSVYANLRTGAPDLERDEAGDLLQRAGLDAEFLDRDAMALSGGEAQRVCLARALAVGPEVLLADEPTSALDAVAVRAVEHTLKALADGGLTVVLVSHDLRQARRLADDLVILVAGRVADAGPATRVLASPDDRARAFLDSGQ